MKSSQEGSQIHYAACQLAAVSRRLCTSASKCKKGASLSCVCACKCAFPWICTTRLECESECFWLRRCCCRCQSALQHKVVADGQRRDRMLGPEGPIRHWTGPRKVLSKIHSSQVLLLLSIFSFGCSSNIGATKLRFGSVLH